jgi:phosphonate transport system substrate-binding protein
MATKHASPRPIAESSGGVSSRRQVVALLLGGAPWLPGVLRAAEADPPIRLAISESLVADVNLNDARAAMQLWIKRIMADLKITIEFDAKVFATSEEIERRVRGGQLDAVALNIVEYRRIAEYLDPNGLLVGGGGAGPDQYLLLVKRSGGIRQLSDLRGRRINLLKAPRMCAATEWLATLLDEAHLAAADGFFGSMTGDTKVARAILPVFFGQADACVASRRGFDTMCEMNPQVGKELVAMASSPQMVVCFYAFRKNFHNASRQKLSNVRGLLATPAGRQLATLFQFDELNVRDGSCLEPALRVLEQAERIRGRKGAAGSVSR